MKTTIEKLIIGISFTIISLTGYTNSDSEYLIDYNSMDLYSVKAARFLIRLGYPHINPSTLEAYFIINPLDLRIHHYFIWSIRPSISASSLTAIELLPNSPWRISGYRINNGSAITYQDFRQNDELMEKVKYHEMFDPEENAEGRFLLLDQEHWIGVFNYPVDADITFSRYNSETEDNKEITINVKRKVTNNFKVGKIYLQTISTSQQSENSKPYQMISEINYPEDDINTLFYQPARVLIDFNTTR